MTIHNDDRVKRSFTRVRTRQLVAIAVAVVCVLLPAVMWTRQDLFGQFSKKDLVLFQIIMILLFVNFTSWNWKCPSCKCYLGADIGTGTCKKCGARLV